MQVRRRWQLPLLYSDQAEAMSAEQRAGIEDGLLDACREVGHYLLQRGRLREAWNYLRPLGSLDDFREAICAVEPTDDNFEQLIELCFYEGLDARRGFQLLLQRYGTCNAITTLHAHVRNLLPVDRQNTAAMLVAHLYQELITNVRSHIEKQFPGAPTAMPLGELLPQYEGLFAERGYHIDTSHLSSTVQLARVTNDPTSWQLARELTDYGRRLDRELQYPCESPFEDTYVAHGHFYHALLDVNRAEALAYFQEKAEQTDTYHQTTFAVEVYIDLLARIGRADEALRCYLQWIPVDVPTTGLIVSPLHLASLAGNFGPLLQHYQDHGRLLEYGAALALAQATATSREVTLSN